MSQMYEIVYEGSDAGIYYTFDDALGAAQEEADVLTLETGIFHKVEIRSAVIGWEDNAHTYFNEIKRTPIYGDCIYVGKAKFAEPVIEE